MCQVLCRIQWWTRHTRIGLHEASSLEEYQWAFQAITCRCFAHRRGLWDALCALYPGQCPEYSRHWINVYNIYSTSALKCYPDVAGSIRWPLFQSGFSLDLSLDINLQNQIHISNISELVILLKILKGDKRKCFPQSHTKLLNKKIQLEISAPPPKFSKSPIKSRRSSFPTPKSSGSPVFRWANTLLLSGKDSWGVVLVLQTFLSQHRSKTVVIYRAIQFILEIVLLYNSV